MASTYLTSGNLSSAGNQKKWTFSAWLKKATTGVDNAFLGYYVGSTNYFIGQWRSDDLLRFGNVDGGSWSVELIPNRVFRDTNAWYHIVFQYDSAQSTSSDRASIWVNGVKETSFAASTYPSQNANTKIPNAGYPITIGRGTKGSNTYYMNGYMTHVHFCDGYAYQASDFGETDSTTGIWKAKTAPSVSYGTNGFFLLKDDNAVTDRSGQGNNYTLGGGTLTDAKDCPDNVFATWNPLAAHPSNTPTFSNGNNTVVGVDTSSQTVSSTLAMPSKGKWYCEMKLTQEANATSSIPNFGIIDAASLYKFRNQELISYNGGVNSYGGRVNSTNLYVDGSSSGTISSAPDVGNIMGLAVDLDSSPNTLKYYLNGALVGTQNINNDEYVFACSIKNDNNAGQVDVNFGNGYFGTTAISSEGANASGNGKFEYDVPSGYTALCTKGLNL